MQLQQKLAGAILRCHAVMKFGSACGDVAPSQLFPPCLWHLQKRQKLVSGLLLCGYVQHACCKRDTKFAQTITV